MHVTLNGMLRSMRPFRSVAGFVLALAVVFSARARGSRSIRMHFLLKSRTTRRLPRAR